MASAKFQIERKCEICGKSFIAKMLTSRYCSKNCSQAAYKQRKKEEQLDALKREKAARVPKNQPYLSIADATALFDIGRDSLYRLIRNKQVRYYNLGLRMIRICKADLQERFNLRPYDERRKEKQSEVKTYRLEPEDCYTIGEIAKKFGLHDSTVYQHIRKYSIPTRQIGNYVYAPKSEIDNLYKH